MRIARPPTNNVQQPCAVVLSHGFSTEKSPLNVDQCFALGQNNAQKTTAQNTN